jgi:hypothetical protein
LIHNPAYDCRDCMPPCSSELSSNKQAVCTRSSTHTSYTSYAHKQDSNELSPIEEAAEKCKKRGNVSFGAGNSVLAVTEYTGLCMSVYVYVCVCVCCCVNCVCFCLCVCASICVCIYLYYICIKNVVCMFAFNVV